MSVAKAVIAITGIVTLPMIMNGDVLKQGGFIKMRRFGLNQGLSRFLPGVHKNPCRLSGVFMNGSLTERLGKEVLK